MYQYIWLWRAAPPHVHETLPTACGAPLLSAVCTSRAHCGPRARALLPRLYAMRDSRRLSRRRMQVHNRAQLRSVPAHTRHVHRPTSATSMRHDIGGQLTGTRGALHAPHLAGAARLGAEGRLHPAECSNLPRSSHAHTWSKHATTNLKTARSMASKGAARSPSASTGQTQRQLLSCWGADSWWPMGGAATHQPLR